MSDDARPMANDAIVVIITGMSGAGKSQAGNVLEDLGYFVVENLPPALVGEVVDRAGVVEGVRPKAAVVVDTRGGLTADDLELTILGLQGRGVTPLVLFLTASDAALVKRYEEARRPHPVSASTLSEAIAAERAALEDVRAAADIVIDTTDLTVHELRHRVEDAFRFGVEPRKMRVDVTSFGFKRGVPGVVDLLFDVRFLPNPHWVAELRPLTGRDAPVREYVLGNEDAVTFLAEVGKLLDFLLPRYEAEGKSYLTIGIGCTGGRHRSVVLAEALGEHIASRGVDVTIHHRDAGLSGDEAHRH
jgi:RNase adapter protein RapZ